MSEELKPCPEEDMGMKQCPFCDGLLYVDVHNTSDSSAFIVSCDSCRICGPMSDTEADAIAAWNRRPIEDKLQDRIDALEWLREVEDYDLWREHPLCTWCGISKSRKGEIFGDAVDEYESINEAAREAVEVGDE